MVLKDNMLTFRKSENILGKIAKKIAKKYFEIEDIIIFGSYMKGKEKPNDIDVLLIFKQKINKQIELEFKKLTNLEIDINSTTLKELEGEGFIAKEGLYLEGKSLVTNKKISESIGFVSIAFIKYDISKIKGSERIKFYYALQGRGKEKGFLSKIGAKRYANNLIVCDYSLIEKVKPFFDYWKLDYQVIPSLIPKRLKIILR